MVNMSGMLNPYERRARLYPALLVVLPVVLTILGAFHEALSVLQSVAGVAVAFGGAFLFSELARDAGKKRELGLVREWGGLPSATIFRHSDARLDPITKAKYHRKLSSLVEGAAAPSAHEEGVNPAAADAVYLAWSNYVRTHTRDQKKYALLFQENVSYGFRRNLLGVRVFGLALSALSVIASAIILAMHHTAGALPAPGEMVALAGSAAFVLLWAVVVRAAWVRTPALGYAERLAEAVDSLPDGARSSPAPKSKQATKPTAKKGAGKK